MGYIVAFVLGVVVTLVGQRAWPMIRRYLRRA
jgi:hypothetical protein